MTLKNDKWYQPKINIKEVYDIQAYSQMCLYLNNLPSDAILGLDSESAIHNGKMAVLQISTYDILNLNFVDIQNEFDCLPPLKSLSYVSHKILGVISVGQYQFWNKCHYLKSRSYMLHGIPMFCKRFLII